MVQVVTGFVKESPNRMLQGPFLRRALVSVLLSLLGAGLLYSAWLGLFLSVYDSLNSLLRALLWLSAPIATGVGYAAGITLAERLTGRHPSRFLRALTWPLIGCAVGAAVAFPFGPMLIVFGMFGAGTASVALREFAIAREAGS